jgi:hypothetical protein
MPTADQINIAIAIISACSTLLTLAVVVATFKILRANQETVSVMKEQIRAVSRPYVQVRPWVRVGTSMLMLTIENTGASAAHNLKLTMDKDFHSNGDANPSRNLRQYTAFVHPIESLPPKAELTFHLGPGHVVFQNGDLCPQRFTVHAEYDFENQSVSERTIVDLQPFQYSAQPTDPIAEQLEKLNQLVANRTH